MLKKILLGSLVVASSLYAGEFEVGKGTFGIKADFTDGKRVSSDVTTLSFVEQHHNIFSSKWFLRYNVTWYDSKDMDTVINDYNSAVSRSTLPTSSTTDTSTTPSTTDTSTTPSTTDTTVPTIDYKLQGLDVNIVIGKDLIHKDERNFLGLGLLFGASFPWIDSKSNATDTAKEEYKYLKDSKTKVMTYKVGPSLSGRYSLGKYFSIYGGASYAYQTASVKNDTLGVDSSSDGAFYSYGAGIRFTPFTYNNDMKYYNLKARLYITAGYRYSHWLVKDVKVTDISIKQDLKMDSSVLYAGIGYSF